MSCLLGDALSPLKRLVWSGDRVAKAQGQSCSPLPSICSTASMTTGVGSSASSEADPDCPGPEEAGTAPPASDEESCDGPSFVQSPEVKVYAMQAAWCANNPSGKCFF